MNKIVSFVRIKMFLKIYLTLVLILIVAVVIETIRYQIYAYKVRKGVFGVTYTTPKNVFNWIRMVKSAMSSIPTLWRK